MQLLPSGELVVHTLQAIPNSCSASSSGRNRVIDTGYRRIATSITALALPASIKNTETRGHMESQRRHPLRSPPCVYARSSYSGTDEILQESELSGKGSDLTQTKIPSLGFINVLLFFLLQSQMLFHLPYPTCDLTALVENVLLRHLPVLQSLDLGTNTQALVKHWDIVSVPLCLTYLRLVFPTTTQLQQMMSTLSPSNTVRTLHITIQSPSSEDSDDELEMVNKLPPMIHLLKFTLVQPFFAIYAVDWAPLVTMTRAKTMPVLRQFNLAIIIRIEDLDFICRSHLFLDHRRIDVRYALSVIDWPSSLNLNEMVLPTSRSHPREISGASFSIIRHVDIESPGSSNLIRVSEHVRWNCHSDNPCFSLSEICGRFGIICGTLSHGPSMISSYCSSQTSASQR